jgi:hypothetical protein
LYLDDLGQVAARGDLVVPFKAEESYLWRLIRNDDMPAKGAKAGRLHQDEKDAVRAWIAAGAPLPPTPPPGSPSPVAKTQESPGTADAPSLPASPSQATRLFGWAGRFHIIVVHFPIALLAAAALAELLAARRSSRVPAPSVRFCVLLGAAGAVAAVGLGWLHADVGGFGAASANILTLHRRLGTTAGVWAAAIAVVSERESRSGRRTVFFRLLLWSGTLMTVATAHFGGVLVHGTEFFDW